MEPLYAVWCTLSVYAVYVPQLFAEGRRNVKLPSSRLGRFTLFFASELLSFFIICCNFRALAKGLYFWTAITDMLIVLQSTLVAKLFIEDEKARDTLSVIAFTLGGACGSLLSIYVTQHIFGG